MSLSLSLSSDDCIKDEHSNGTNQLLPSLSLLLTPPPPICTFAAAFIRNAFVASGLPHSSQASPLLLLSLLPLASRRKNAPRAAHASSAPSMRKSHGGLLTTSAALPLEGEEEEEEEEVTGVQSLASSLVKRMSCKTPAMAASLRANAMAAGCQSLAQT